MFVVWNVHVPKSIFANFNTGVLQNNYKKSNLNKDFKWLSKIGETRRKQITQVRKCKGGLIY